MLIDNLDCSKEYKLDLILCRSYDRKQLAQLNDYILYNTFQLHKKLDDFDDISFEVPYYIVENNQTIENPIYDLIIDGYLILLNEKQYFIIESPEENGIDRDKKIIKAYSYEKTLNNKNLIDYEDTAQIHKTDVETGEGVLDRFVADNTEWSIGYIDNKARIDEYATGAKHNKYRTFSIDEKPWLQFLREDFSQAFHCVCFFDTVNMTINIYDKDSVGTDKGWYISEKNYLKTIKKKLNTERIVSRLFCYGKNGLVINDINPTGLSYVFDYSYWRNLNYMPQDLLDAFTAFDTLIESKKGQFSDLLVQINTVDGQKTDREAELTELNNQLSLLKTQKTILIKEQADLSSINSQIDSKNTEITNKQTEINNLETQLSDIKTQKSNLVKSLSFESNFTAEQLKIINSYGMYTTWKNETITKNSDLFEEGKKTLKEYNTPLAEFEVSNANFLKMIECQDDWNFELGDIADVEYIKLKMDVKVRLIEYTYQPSSNSLQLIFSNKLFKDDITRQIGQGLSKAVSAGNVISKKKYIWDLSESNTLSIDDIMTNNFDLMKQAVATSDNTVNIDKHGIVLQDRNNRENMLFITNSVIAMSTDGGNTFRVGVRPEGIVCETLIGKILIGEKVYIEDETGQLSLKGNLLTIKDNNGVVRIRLGKYSTNAWGLQILSKNNGQVILDENGMMQSYGYSMPPVNIDYLHPVKLKFYIDESTISIKNVKLSLTLEKYRTFEKATSSGGSLISTTDSGGSASITSDNGGYSTQTSSFNGDYSNTLTSWNEDWANPAGFLPVLFPPEYPNGCIGQASFDHKHRLNVNIGSHSHSLSIPNHSHLVSIPNHSHPINLPNHNHSLEYGIYEGLSPETVYIKINGNLITDSVGGDINNLELANYVTSTGWQTLEIGSKSTVNNPNGLGSITPNIYIKYFCGM